MSGQTRFFSPSDDILGSYASSVQYSKDGAEAGRATLLPSPSSRTGRSAPSVDGLPAIPRLFGALAGQTGSKLPVRADDIGCEPRSLSVACGTSSAHTPTRLHRLRQSRRRFLPIHAAGRTPSAAPGWSVEPSFPPF